MKKILLTVTGFIAVAMLFSGVGYAAATWLNFEGEEDIQQSEDNIDKILDILKEVSEGKITAENAIPALEKRIKDLEDMDPSGLAKLNKELREKNEQLKTDNGILSTDLASKDTQLRKQSETIEKLNADLTSANQAKIDAENALAGKEQELESKQQKINDKNAAYDILQKERDDVTVERDNYKAQVDENSNYIKHLEAELTTANSLAEEHSSYTEEALKKAESYK